MTLYERHYIDVLARFDKDGTIFPVLIYWDDEISFDIDKVIDVRRAAALKAGGMGMRYKCLICGEEKYLFLEESKWFVETKIP